MYVALLWITRSLVFNFFFLYMSPQPAASSRVSRSLTVSLSPALNCSVEFAATGQIHVVSCCPHQVSVPQCRRDSNLYASAPHRGSSRGEACQQGYCCLHQQAREHYGVSLPALVRKPDQYTVVPGSNEARWVPAPDAVLTRQAWAASADA